MMDIIKELLPEIQAAGQPYEVREKKRHRALYIGERLVAIIPRSGKQSEHDRRSFLNTRAQIRRAIAGRYGR